MVLAALASEDEPGFNEPGLGDFVVAVAPADESVLTPEDFERRSRTVALVLDFFAAEGQFGFGALRSFRYDGDEVADEVEVLPEGGPPPDRVSLVHRAAEAAEGEHTVEVEYADSRGTLHRVRWSFRIEG